jgi:hypothetical protein
MKSISTKWKEYSLYREREIGSAGKTFSQETFRDITSKTET